MTTEQARQQLISLVEKETTKYDLGQYWITDKVAFNMREMIKEFRKNYYGIFDVPIDPITKREKLWVPLTRTLCDAVRKSVDLDPKDVRFRSTDISNSHITHLVRGAVREYFDEIYFGHQLNQLISTLVVDGTDVWKTFKDGKKVVRKDVDLLNVYIDPTADSIQDAYRFTERVLMTKSEVNGMTWENVDKFTTEEDLEKETDSYVKKAGEFGDVYESWGFYPRNLIKAANGEKFDPDDSEEIESQVVVSGFDTGSRVFHLAKENKEKDAHGNIIKPYEEAWYLKMPGRWYGVGIAETVLKLQWWINTVVNLRINKNTVAQMGLLKVRKGSGVTQQMLQNLASKGVIQLENVDTDLTNMRIDEAGQSSYQDEETARKWAQDVTSVFDVNLGELPASTSATGAAIQDRQSQSAYSLTTEAIEHFIQRWVNRHVLQHVPMMIKEKKKTFVFSDFEEVKKLRERVVANLVTKQMDENYKKNKTIPTEEQLQKITDRMLKRLEDRGDLLFEVLEDIVVNDMQTKVFMTNADLDVGVTVRNLLELRNGLDPQTSAEMTAQALDLLGLEVPDSLRNPQPATPEQPQPTSGNAENVLSSVQEVANANTLNNEQR